MTGDLGLGAHARNVYSQCGEDGIIEALLERLPDGDHWCVEFGAWDGGQLSNTRRLIDEGWSAVLIEGDSSRADRLQERFADNPRVVGMQAMVGWEGERTLDRLLAPTAVPHDFDLLSIDIDGNDYHVWRALQDYRPRIVVIEYNPTIPDDIHFVQEADDSVRKGSSISALVALAAEKGYQLAATTLINAIFVREDQFAHLGITDNSLAALRTDHSWELTAFMGYDGELHVIGEHGMPWHQAPLPDAVRILPRPLTGFPGDFGTGRKALLHLWREWRKRRAGDDEPPAGETPPDGSPTRIS